MSHILAVTHQRLADVQQAVAGEVLRRLVERSPVDTGQFKANWRVGLGAADTSTTTATDKDGAATIATGQAALAAASAGAVFLTNALPYALALEYGWSQQAPAGMVALTKSEIPMIVDWAVRAARRTP